MSVKIIVGINELNVNKANSTVGEIKDEIGALVSLNGDETAKVNGSAVSESDVVKDGDVLEFIKPAGDKGSVTIISGINELKVAAEGRSIDDVKDDVESILNLEGNETVKVNGEVADLSDILDDGDKVEFVKPAGDKGSVTVIAGINELKVSANGKTVGTIVDEVRSILNLSGEEDVKVNGSDVNEDTVVNDGDKVEFVKPAGDKGESK